jgi:hypothetical protein
MLAFCALPSLSKLNCIVQLVGRPLRFPNLPCINVGPSSSKPVFIPPEMCAVVPGQRRTKLTPMQTREIIKLAAQRPMVRGRHAEGCHPSNLTLGKIGMKGLIAAERP